MRAFIHVTVASLFVQTLVIINMSCLPLNF